MIKKKPFKFYFLMLLFIIAVPTQVCAWDTSGHRLVAQIAYEHLTPTVQKKVNKLVQPISQYYPGSDNFITVSYWADQLKRDDVSAFSSWHFISIPLITKQRSFKQRRFKWIKRPRVQKQNVVWAINQSLAVLESPKSNQFEKGLFLRFLIHFVGDIHQPLHCANRVTREFPNGDGGGTLFLIKTRYSDNLHRFWDSGLGFFGKFYRNYPLRAWQITQLAKKIEQRYPIANFTSKINDINPYDWANEGFLLAKNVAYNEKEYKIREQSKPSKKYIKKGQEIVQQRIALAGYRLAKLLNGILGA